MTEQTAADSTPEQRARISMLLQILGLSDVVLGLAAAIFMPVYLDLETYLAAIIGGALALGGIALWGIGRFGYGRRANDREIGPAVVRRR